LPRQATVYSFASQATDPPSRTILSGDSVRPESFVDQTLRGENTQGMITGIFFTGLIDEVRIYNRAVRA
jgi:hypothetical protein